jgi:hypothetical protein
MFISFEAFTVNTLGGWGGERGGGKGSALPYVNMGYKCYYRHFYSFDPNKLFLFKQ